VPSAELAPDAGQLWSSMRQGTTADRIAERILGHITAQRLRPGTKLPSERELAALLGVSRPSLREAMRSLQARGHVVVRHGSGVYVAEPSASRALRSGLADAQLSMRELYDMREVIELAAAEWAARRHDREELASVQHAYEELDAASTGPDVDFEQLAALDTAFHLRIVEAAGNRFLTQTLGVLHDILATGMRTTLTIPGRLERSRRDHERICRAIMAGDPAAARRAAKAHVDAARRAALRRLESEKPAPMSPT
jgi:GntR family transcriptional regulator, transcriptional repressor for pyruvate dehydrogenase complex